MAFDMYIKQVSIDTNQIKDGQPAILLGNKVIVAGVGGDFIPAGQGGTGTEIDLFDWMTILMENN